MRPPCVKNAAHERKARPVVGPVARAAKIVAVLPLTIEPTWVKSGGVTSVLDE